MKNISNIKLGFITVLFTFAMILSSCEYQEFADTDYPDQLIYMPAAYYNPYMIDEVPVKIGDSPTPGNPERFTLDLENRKLNVLLAAYRSGINASGTFDINVSVNNDTIENLLASSEALPGNTVLLQPENYSLVNSVQMKEGERLAKFDLEVDLNYLVNNAPDGVFAVGVEISSQAREVNPDLALTVVVIDTEMLLPSAAFLFMVNGNTLITRNNSENAVSYLWDFGDGETSTEFEPEHVYAEPGTYTLTLEAIGITGEDDKSVVSKTVTVR